MSNQIFKKQIPNELLFNLFEVLCIKNEKYYLFTINSFKKGIWVLKAIYEILIKNDVSINCKRKFMVFQTLRNLDGVLESER